MEGKENDEFADGEIKPVKASLKFAYINQQIFFKIIFRTLIWKYLKIFRDL